jgi:hypothetical protein
MSFRQLQPYDELNPVYEVRCRHCQIFVHVPCTKYQQLLQLIQSEGWGKRNGVWTCPICMQKPIDKLKSFVGKTRRARLNTESATSNATRRSSDGKDRLQPAKAEVGGANFGV